MKPIMIMVFAGILSGCSDKSIPQWQKDIDAILLHEMKTGSENCLKHGGIVIRSGWDNRIIDCKATENIKP